MNIKKIFSPVALLALSSLISRVLGVLRDHFLAVKFGATTGVGIYDLDTYYAAFRIPDLIYNFLIMGTISAAFVPIFSGYLAKKQEEEGFRFASIAINFLLILMLIIVLLVFIFAPWLVKIIAPGFSGEKLQITINLTRLMLVSPIIFGLSSIVQGIQNSYKTFLSYSLAPVIYNLSIIAGILYLGDRQGVYGVTIGVIIGAFLHLLIQIPQILKLGFKYSFDFNFRRQDIKKMFRLIMPRIFGASATQLTLIVDTMIGSTLALGSITILNYAHNLNSLPMGMIGVSYAIVSFATLSELAANDNFQGFIQELKENIIKILYLVIPAAGGMFILRYEIVYLILKSGKFTSDDAILTAKTLGFLLIGLFAQSLIHLLSRAFYALHNTKTPVKIGILTVVLNIIGSLFLAKELEMGVAGLALANTMAGIINFTLLGYFLQKRLDFRNSIIAWDKVMMILLNTVIMVVVVLGAKWGFVSYFGRPSGFMMYFAEIALLVAVGAISYFLLSKREKIIIGKVQT